MEIEGDTVLLTVTANQKRDKFVGVVFGDDLEDTYQRAWERVTSPPRMNIVLPKEENTVIIGSTSATDNRFNAVKSSNEKKKTVVVILDGKKVTYTEVDNIVYIEKAETTVCSIWTRPILARRAIIVPILNGMTISD